MARILIADQLSQDGIEMLSAEHEVELWLGLSEDALVEAVTEVQGLIVRSETQVTARVVEAGGALMVIGRAGVGVDNIDVNAATACGIIVVNAPLANTVSTAEHTLGMMLALARNIPQGDASLRAGRWDRSAYTGIELRGRTLGVIGLGRIGNEVARRARAFEMRVIAADPFVSQERANAVGVELVEFDALLAQSDFITLHSTLYEGTRGLLGPEQFALMSPGTRIVNCARGGLIDEQALYDAVESGAVAGAAIDVFSEEPAVGNILATSERIIVTPHLAASTAEAQAHAAIETAQQVLDVLEGKPARFAVNAPLVDPETMAVIGPYIDAAELAAMVATQLVEGRVERAEVQYRGEIANYESAPMRAAVIVGMLARITEEKVTVVNAERFAEQHGIRIDEDRGPAREPYANLVTVSVYGSGGTDGAVRVSATHSPQGARVVHIGEYEDVEVSPAAAPNALAIENLDRPGMVGKVGTLLGGWDVNVNYMSVSASPSGERALMVLGTNRALTPAEAAEVLALDNIDSLRQLDLRP